VRTCVRTCVRKGVRLFVCVYAYTVEPEMPNHYMPNINIFILARPYILTPLSPPPPPSYTHKNVHARTHTRAHKPIQSCIIAVDTSGLVCVWDTVSAAQITW